MLRFYEGRNLRDVGAALGATEDAAEKRVSRAIERLREFFAKRGVTAGASGLVAVISANAVQAAPAGLAVTISTDAALAGITLTTTASVTATKAIAMTTLQKTIIGAAFVATVGTGVYEARQASALRVQNQMLTRQQAPLVEQIQDLQQERDDASNRLARLADENATLKNNSAELMKLRGEVGILRRQNQELAQARVSTTKDSNTQTVNKGFGTLGEYLAMEQVSDAGNNTPEALLKTFVWAIREGDLARLQHFGAPLGGPSKPGDVAGEIPESVTAVFKTIQNVITNSAGFRLSSGPVNGDQKHKVRLDAMPFPDRQDDPLMKNFSLSFILEQKADGWGFGNPSEESASKSE